MWELKVRATRENAIWKAGVAARQSQSKFRRPFKVAGRIWEPMSTRNQSPNLFRSVHSTDQIAIAAEKRPRFTLRSSVVLEPSTPGDPG